jgi:hypothetical protein
LFACLLLCITVVFLQCLPLIRLWFYVVFAHNVITCIYTVLSVIGLVAVDAAHK